MCPAATCRPSANKARATACPFFTRACFHCIWMIYHYTFLAKRQGTPADELSTISSIIPAYHISGSSLVCELKVLPSLSVSVHAFPAKFLPKTSCTERHPKSHTLLDSPRTKQDPISHGHPYLHAYASTTWSIYQAANSTGSSSVCELKVCAGRTRTGAGHTLPEGTPQCGVYCAADDVGMLCGVAGPWIAHLC
jgi:hypothetical protein